MKAKPIQICVFFLCFLSCVINTAAQQPIIPSPYHLDPDDPANILYNDAAIPRIDVAINPTDFDQLFVNPNSDTEFPATFVFTSGIFTDTVTQIGLGLKGNSSLSSAKKSFKISFNTYTPGNKYKGLEKINLNGEHNDPSIIRAKLYWDLAAKMGIPAPRANHIAFYVNGLYMGLYISVEHIDEEFVQNRFGNNSGNLYKCLYPASLEYINNNPESYKFEQNGRRAYELQTNTDLDDYSDLLQLITAVNQPDGPNYAGNLDAVFNVDSYLRVLALDIFTGNWDNYSYNINNYYLYRNTHTGKFEFMPYDTDNTFGIDWFGVDWATRNVYNWSPQPNFPPLATKLLNVPEFRNRFTYYFNTLLQTAANPDVFFPRIDDLHSLITPFAEADIFRTYDYGYSIADFHDSYDEALGAHVTYGLKPYITARRNAALAQLLPQNTAPVIVGAAHQPELPVAGQNIQISAIVFDNNAAASPQAWLYYRINGGSFTAIAMQDDGTSGDALENDGIFGAVLSGIPAFSLIEYYITATDDLGAQNRAPLAENSYRQVYMAQSAAPLVINEFMASNSNSIADEFGEYADWIEIYNAGTEPVNLGAFFLTDDLSNPTKWQMPNVSLAANGFLLIWADDDVLQGPTHAPFKLSAGGEQIGIFGPFAQPVYTLTYGPQQTNLTQGLLPDGAGDLQNLSAPTPGYSNLLVSVQPQASYQPALVTGQPFPNPFANELTVPFTLQEPAQVTINLFTADGKAVFTSATAYQPGQHNAALPPLNLLQSGLYYITMVAYFSGGRTQKTLKKALKY